MKIIADKNIPFAGEAFSRLGEVRLLPGRRIDRDAVKDADALLVRTVTRVDESLLGGTAVKFAGTATIGCDHVDLDYLRKNSIGFSYAPGSNANSVAEYILSALFTLSKRFGFNLSDKTAGIIGCGNVGDRVCKKLKILGVRTLVNDPPLYEITGDKKYIPLEILLKEADIITVHTPLTGGGKYPTRGLCGESFFEAAGKAPIFINSSRGAVCDSAALLSALESGAASHAVLDVWENEPGIDLNLLKKCALGTPHIAGYSLDGKANATMMLFKAVCRHFNLEEKWEPENMPPPSNPLIETELGLGEEKTVGEAVLKAYNIAEDDLELRKIFEVKDEEKAEYFDSLRNNYPVRREFSSFTVKAPDDGGNCLQKLQKLGFKTRRAR